MTGRRIIFGVGVAALILGLLFMAQGSGLFPYPRTSFMIDQRPWVLRGLLLAVAGTLASLYARRR